MVQDQIGSHMLALSSPVGEDMPTVLKRWDHKGVFISSSTMARNSKYPTSDLDDI
jgi:hypothetical protein